MKKWKGEIEAIDFLITPAFLKMRGKGDGALYEWMCVRHPDGCAYFQLCDDLASCANEFESGQLFSMATALLSVGGVFPALVRDLDESVFSGPLIFPGSVRVAAGALKCDSFVVVGGMLTVEGDLLVDGDLWVERGLRSVTGKIFVNGRLHSGLMILARGDISVLGSISAEVLVQSEWGGIDVRHEQSEPHPLSLRAGFAIYASGDITVRYGLSSGQGGICSMNGAIRGDFAMTQGDLKARNSIRIGKQLSAENIISESGGIYADEISANGCITAHEEVSGVSGVRAGMMIRVAEGTVKTSVEYAIVAGMRVPRSSWTRSGYIAAKTFPHGYIGNGLFMQSEDLPNENI